MPEPAQRQSLVPEPNLTPIPTLPKSLEVATSTVSRPEVSDLSRIQPAQRQPFVPHPNTHPNTTPIPALPKSSDAATTSTISRPNASDIPRIQRLTRESCDISRQINASSVRYANIISELKQLNSTFIPGPLKVGTPDSSKHQPSFLSPSPLYIQHRLRNIFKSWKGG